MHDHHTFCSCILICGLTPRTKIIINCLSRSVVTENQSKARRDFDNVRVILHCTELCVQNPSKLDARKQVYSNYKHHNTFKLGLVHRWEYNRSRQTINDNFRSGPLVFSLNICGIPISPFQYRKCLALVL
jgi:hypothetical protein